MLVFWVVSHYELVGGYQSFGETYVSVFRVEGSETPHDVITHNTNIIFTAVKISRSRMSAVSFRIT
jgi:hypothetical protein